MSTSSNLALTGRSTVLHADSFAAIAKAETPFAWPVAHFYKEVTSSESRLEAFTSGDVRDIVCYKDGVHEYLLMCVHIQNQGVPLVWVRTERHPVKQSIAKMSSQSLAALDTIKFSYDRSKLWNAEDDNMMASAFATLNFRHVIDLLNTVHEVSNNYGITGLNCMWYAGVVMGTLQGGFGKVWVNPPRRDWVKIALRLFGRDTTKATQSVENRFAIKRPGMNRFSLMEQEAWQNERHSPQSSNQVPLDDPPQYDPTPTHSPDRAAQPQASGSDPAPEIPASPPPDYDASTADSRDVTPGMMARTLPNGIAFVPPNLVPIDPSSEPSWTWDPVTNVYRLGHTFVPMSIPLSHASSSKQHDRHGADSKLADTKEKTATIDSPSFPLDKRARAHRTVQSPNANDATPASVAEAKKNSGGQRRGRKMNTHPPLSDRLDALGSKAPEHLMAPNPRPRSRSRSRNRPSSHTNEARPMQPATASSTSIPITHQMVPKKGSIVVGEVPTIPKGVMTLGPSAEASRPDLGPIAPTWNDDSGFAPDNNLHPRTAGELVPSIVNADEIPEGALFGSTQQRQPRKFSASNPPPTVDIIPASEPVTSQVAQTATGHAPHLSQDVPAVGDKNTLTPKKDTSNSVPPFDTSRLTATVPLASKMAGSAPISTQPLSFAATVQTTRLVHQAFSGVARQRAPRLGPPAPAQTPHSWPDPHSNTKSTSNLLFPSIPATNHSDVPRDRRVSGKRFNSFSTVTSSGESTKHPTNGGSRSQPQTPAASRPGTPTRRRRRRGKSNAAR